MSKIKVLTLSDHPLSPSGVGTQTKYMCEALLKTGRYEIISLGGAIKHKNYNPVQVEPYGEDWKIVPVDGYGTQDMIRSILKTEKPDILWFMTDPRFYGWLWEIENEIRPLCSMVYYHVWDNFPTPMFNRRYYLSNDHIATISKVTDEIVKQAAPEVDRTYIPHAVHPDVFRPFSDEDIKKIRENSLIPEDREKVIFFWNNRNARRKQSGTLVWWFKEWLDKENLHDKACLIMHTEPKDPHGQDLEHIINHLKLEDRQIMLSTQKISPQDLASMYNMVDCTINISDAEGFGLATLESLSCGTPIIVNMTGGLQEQVTDGNNEFGIPIFPTSKSVIGSQQVPYIYEDRISKKQFHSALNKIYKMGQENRRQLGMDGRQHVLDNYNFLNFEKQWVETMDSVYEKKNSRDIINIIRFKEVA
ncbi:MAG: putative glycosyl transferases group 1 [Prokaryotic dsDNA virus sp.]|nr:MAG: putative glycosyl transferases group 1 [Prokaryotic dsDNA virus sp.]